MDKESMRLIEPGNPPTPKQIESWIGKIAYGYWTRLADMISGNYPDVFTPEWLYGGKKHGWALRYKKSKSFCTFIPEKNRFAIQIVFGAKEREKVESIRSSISEATLAEYDQAKTYHDGKWLYLSVDSDTVINDVELLLSTKRKPKGKK